MKALGLYSLTTRVIYLVFWGWSLLFICKSGKLWS